MREAALVSGVDPNASDGPERADFFIDLLEDHFQLAMDFLASMARNIVSIRKQSARQE